MVEDPRWLPTREALARLATKGARLWWIREDGEVLLRLRCVEDTAETLRAEGSPPLENLDSDGRAEAVIEILKTCIAPSRSLQRGRLLWIVLDLDGKYPKTTAEERRRTAGEQVRDKGSKTLSASTIRQGQERTALDWLTDALLEHEDAHIAKRVG